MRRYLFLLVVIFGACQDARPQQDKPVSKTIVKTSAMDTTEKVYKTEEEWKKILTPEQYHVLREKGTDAPFTGKLTLNKEKGSYSCAACGNELFNSDMKFESH
jgi:hypothetical protein